MYSVGIDENGLGPLLGPLVVTGAGSNISHASTGSLKDKTSDFPGLRDSKKVFNQKNLRTGEALALSLIRVLGGAMPSTMMDLLRVLHCEATGTFPLPCLEGKAGGFCLEENLRLPLWCGVEDVERTEAVLAARLTDAGYKNGCIVSSLLCPCLLNEKLAGGINKFSVDLRAFLETARVFRSLREGPIDVIAGKVGSRVSYEDEIGAFFGGAPEIITKGRRESAYRLADGLNLRFIVDADDSFVHVSMASLVGKYVREVFMEAVYRFAAARCGPLRRPSGYHDRVSKEFIATVGPRLSEWGVCKECFIRIR